MSAVVAPMRWPGLKSALVLGAAGTLSVFAVLPYAMSLLPPETLSKLPPMPVLYAAQGAQSAVMLTLMAWAGIVIGRRVGLGAPWIAARVEGMPAHGQAFPTRLVVLSSALVCLLVLLLNAVAQSWLPPISNPPRPTPLQGFFASFYAGIAEEIQLRLFLMTMLTWGLLKLGLGRAAALFAANGVAAILFGVAHLPAAAQVWPLTFAVVAYVVVANASAGVVFGALYARHGLEAAIAAHFVADIGLHVIAPVLLS